jgi:hypothetical protein
MHGGWARDSWYFQTGSTHLGETARRWVQRSAPAGAAKAEEPSGSAERRADGRKVTEDLRRATAAANWWRGAMRGGAADAAAATGGHGADAMGWDGRGPRIGPRGREALSCFCWAFLMLL